MLVAYQDAGQISGGAHRVFLVTGPLEVASNDDGSPSACIIDTSGPAPSGSCVRTQEHPAPLFGVDGGWRDSGSEFRVVMGLVPESTSVVIVTTPRGTFWQVPRGGISFFVLQVSSDATLEWQFLDPAGVVLSTGRYGQ